MKRLSIEEMREIAKKKGGECLSEKYVNCDFKLRWRCGKGHEWDASPDSVKRISWCPICGGTNMLTIEEMQEIAKNKGGQCLSDKYIKANLKLKWKCKRGHEWMATPSKIKRGTWCPVCSNETSVTIEEMQEIAKNKGGQCLSDKYHNSTTKLDWMCHNKHKWSATPRSITVGYWCPECRKLTIEDMVGLANEKNGKCLSDKCSGAHTPLLWECEKKSHLESNSQ